MGRQLGTSGARSLRFDARDGLLGVAHTGKSCVIQNPQKNHAINGSLLKPLSLRSQSNEMRPIGGPPPAYSCGQVAPASVPHEGDLQELCIRLQAASIAAVGRNEERSKSPKKSKLSNAARSTHQAARVELQMALKSAEDELKEMGLSFDDLWQKWRDQFDMVSRHLEEQTQDLRCILQQQEGYCKSLEVQRDEAVHRSVSLRDGDSILQDALMAEVGELREKLRAFVLGHASRLQEHEEKLRRSSRECARLRAKLSEESSYRRCVAASKPKCREIALLRLECLALRRDLRSLSNEGKSM